MINRMVRIFCSDTSLSSRLSRIVMRTMQRLHYRPHLFVADRLGNIPRIIEQLDFRASIVRTPFFHLLWF